MKTIFEFAQRMTFLETALASAGMGHFILDPKRRTVEFSAWVRDNIGLNDMPIPFERLAEIVPPEEREAFTQTVANVIAQEADFTFETNVVTSKGVIRAQRISGIAAFEDPSRRTGLIGFFGIVQEITGEKAALQELREARDGARAQSLSRSNLLAVVSHEIRTPLGGILGIIGELKAERSPAERARALDLIADSCDVLLDTLDAILEQERVDKDFSNIAAIQFRPALVATRVAELFRPLARRKGLRIEIDATADAEVIGDPVRLQQVLANLVSNGVKFTRSGAVTICVQRPLGDGEEWVFVVSDTGTGIDRERLPTLFHPFSGSAEDSLGRVGAGLGLSITNELVRKLGGSITVDSTLGEGTDITVHIPFTPARAAFDEWSHGAKRGQAVVIVARASDAIRAEAAFNAYGYDIVSLEKIRTGRKEHDRNFALIADAARIESIPRDIIDQCNHLIGIVGDEEARSLAHVEDSRVAFVASDKVGEALKALLGGPVS